MKLTIALPCVRCGCMAFENDPERGLVCILCARPLQPVVSDAPWIGKHDAKINDSIERERRTIDAAIAAGRRVWS